MRGLSGGRAEVTSNHGAAGALVPCLGRLEYRTIARSLFDTLGAGGYLGDNLG